MQKGFAMTPDNLRGLSTTCFMLAFISIPLSVVIFFAFSFHDPAQGQRLGIFVGLWPPTLFALSDRLDRYASRKEGDSGARNR
jgi:hypothetical protein